MGAGRVLCVMTFYVDACALVYFQFYPRSVGRSVDPGTTSRHFGTKTKIHVSVLLISMVVKQWGLEGD